MDNKLCHDDKEFLRKYAFTKCPHANSQTLREYANMFPGHASELSRYAQWAALKRGRTDLASAATEDKRCMAWETAIHAIAALVKKDAPCADSGGGAGAVV